MSQFNSVAQSTGISLLPVERVIPVHVGCKMWNLYTVPSVGH